MFTIWSMKQKEECGGDNQLRPEHIAPRHMAEWEHLLLCPASCQCQCWCWSPWHLFICRNSPVWPQQKLILNETYLFSRNPKSLEEALGQFPAKLLWASIPSHLHPNPHVCLHLKNWAYCGFFFSFCIKILSCTTESRDPNRPKHCDCVSNTFTSAHNPNKLPLPSPPSLRSYVTGGKVKQYSDVFL